MLEVKRGEKGGMHTVLVNFGQDRERSHKFARVAKVHVFDYRGVMCEDAGMNPGYGIELWSSQRLSDLTLQSWVAAASVVK